MSDWYVLIDPRTKKEKKVRKFKGVIYPQMQASITNIDKFGLTTIKFSQKMQVQEAKSITNDVLFVEVIAHIGSVFPDKLNFEWECVDFNEETMKLKLTFENPLYVSYGKPDMLVVKVKDSSFFRREAFEDYLPKLYSMDRKILSIMERSPATAILSDSTDSVKTALDASIVF